METILNLAWLAVTFAAIWLWRFRWNPSRRELHHNPRNEAIAIVCFIALSFPVISLTDDLHPEILVADAASSKRNSCLMMSAAHHAASVSSASAAHTAVGILPSGFAPVQLSAAKLLEVSIRFITSFAAVSSAGRSPPYPL